ncbi:transcriptional regulator [Vibrio sp. V27_P1S3P104]|uniref:HlyU family transcriptional regulator n=1 Tax=unclassified Vibrio TaxID=2614977 RepID=UPI001372BB2A|nr:transcriptional regulator [Vibrio sp. V28_P6S34P95]NAX04739.1 transcriptional regulator [Vibrio sp. V30_P3S12P165]NAX37797.1 transcriptional regulator [Vibrio sp. V27_P1S3P104]NAX40829.1 transcriptional regulator [Vibrio sp. V26_P1S5P106]
MGLFSRWFSRHLKNDIIDEKPYEYKGFLIYQEPINEHGQYRIAGRIIQEVNGEWKEHRFIRSDLLSSEAQAKELMLKKAQLYIDQMSGQIFQ